jgi:anti-anti-sigma factor
VILNLLADLDLENADLDRLAELLIRSDPAPHIVLNLSNVEFVSSTFLGRLLAMQKRINAAKGTLVLCGMNTVVREIFEVTKLETFFNFSDDEAGA